MLHVFCETAFTTMSSVGNGIPFLIVLASIMYFEVSRIVKTMIDMIKVAMLVSPMCLQIS